MIRVMVPLGIFDGLLSGVLLQWMISLSCWRI